MDHCGYSKFSKQPTVMMATYSVLTMENREDVARISVGTVQDWHSLKATYRDSALESIRAQITSNNALGCERDALLMHADEFIERTIGFVQQNLRINGNTFESFDESGREMELFDEALDRRIWSLADTRLQWHKRIAEVRRTIPSEIETNISILNEQHGELDTINLAQIEHAEEPMMGESSVPQRVEQIVQQSSALSNELNQTISQQQGRGERIRIIASEISSLKP